MNLEDNYLSMKSLVDAQKSMSLSDFSRRAYALLMKSIGITDLIDNLRLLTIAKLSDIVSTTLDYSNGLSDLINKLFREDAGQSWLQFTDVDIFVSACEVLISYVNEMQAKQDLIELSLSLSVNYNRWECMRKVVTMINGLGENEITYMSLFFIENKDILNFIQGEINLRLKPEIRRFLS